MSKEKEELLKTLKIEDLVWFIYLIIIGLSFYSNYIERIYIYTNSEESKNKYRTINIIIFIIFVLICAYFTYENYQAIIKLKDSDSDNKKNLTYIELVASLFALLSALLFLYAAIKDIDIETEIAFN